MIARRTAALVLGACLLAACSGEEPELSASSSDAPQSTGSTPEPTSSPSPTAAVAGSGSPSAVAEPEDDADLPPFPATTAVDEEQPEGGPLSVTTVRAARQDGYDRVVLELGGEQPGQPGWRVEYVDEPRQDGSGDLVEVAGDAVLQVTVTGVGYPFDTGVEEEASTDLTPSGTEVVREVDLQATFEGQYQAFVGLSREVPFRVFRLSDPARVVIDVRHS